MVVRINVREAVGIQMARMYNVLLVPTFIVFNSSGNEEWRQGGQWPNERKIITKLLGESVP